MKKSKILSIVPDETIINKIYMIRGSKVMLDKDLAFLYGVKPIRLREQVKRNLQRFPVHFMFQLTDKEVDIMVSQNAIPSKKHLGGSLPFAFTEHGVLMLANVIKNAKAVQMSIRIIEVFIQMRECLMANNDILLKLEHLEKNVNRHTKDIIVLFDTLRELLAEPEKSRKRVGYKHYD